MAYTTAALCRTYLGIAASETGDDTLIGTLITKATGIIDNYCGRTFEAAANTDRKFTIGVDTYGPYLYFDKDLATINSITNGDSTTVTSAQYITLGPDAPYYGVKLLGSSGITWTFTTDPERAITVSGKWAWSASAPNDIVHATERLVAFLYRQKDTSQDVGAVVTDTGLTIYPSDLPKDIQAILTPYRRIR